MKQVSRKTRQAHIVVDLSNGDVGKGTITDFLVRHTGAHTVIRFNGGAQAGHNVCVAPGCQHVFAQFGSGTLVPGVRTHLTRFVVVAPLALQVEAEQLFKETGVADAFDRLTVSAEALVVTPFERAANQLREISRGGGRHGSCGMGIGETVFDSWTVGRSVLRVGDLRDADTLRRKLRWLQSHKRAQLADTIERCRSFSVAEDALAELEGPTTVDDYIEMLAPVLQRMQIVEDDLLKEILSRNGDVVFEGSQGVLLEEWFGFHPYTTWSTCTFANALALLEECGYSGAINRVGTVRAYSTRHGPGPFVTEDAALTAALPDNFNFTNPWQRNFRVGWFDAVATRYAIEVCGGIDTLAVTCFDRLQGHPEWQLCEAYDTPVGRWTRIPVGPPRDLGYQEYLTEMLMRSKPVLKVTTSAAEFEVRVREHLQQMCRELGYDMAKIPIIISCGPTAADKKWSSPV